jgi:hypothetical protein
MQYCPACGTQANDEARTCPSCYMMLERTRAPLPALPRLPNNSENVDKDGSQIERASWILAFCSLVPFLGAFLMVPAMICAGITINRGRTRAGIACLLIASIGQALVNVLFFGTFFLTALGAFASKLESLPIR